MATALNLIESALTEIGVRAAGETLPADEASDGLVSLNRMIDQWAAERLTIHTVTRTTWTITASDGQYTVGTGANVNVARPVYVDHVNFLDTATDPDTEYPLVPFTEDAWAGVRLKAATAVYPSNYYYNPTHPTGTLDLWPVPTSTTLTGAFYAPTAVAQFAALTTSVSLPPGYERALLKNLAVELLPSYGRQPDPLLIEQARDAKAVIKRANKRPMDLSLDAAALISGGRAGSYDISTG